MSEAAAKPEVKNATLEGGNNTPVSVAPKTERKRKITKDQRNADGTFKKGNAGGGRPPETMSARQQAKIMAAKDPDLLNKVLNNLYEIASDKNHSQCVAAADKLVKLLGNYDPQETKDVTPKAKPNPFDNLTEEELRKLAGEK